MKKTPDIAPQGRAVEVDGSVYALNDTDPVAEIHEKIVAAQESRSWDDVIAVIEWLSVYRFVRGDSLRAIRKLTNRIKRDVDESAPSRGMMK